MFRLLFVCCALTTLGCSTEQTTETPSTETQPKSNATASSAASSPSSAKASAKSPKVFVIDVRSKAEWESGHVAQAVHIPHTEIGSRIVEVTNDKDANIVVYCRVGGRAKIAKDKLEELGFTNVENGGGYDDVKDRFKDQAQAK